MNPTSPTTVERGSVFLHAIRAALSRVPLWLLVTLAFLALSLPASMLAHDAMADASAHRYAPGELVRSLSVNFVTDHADEREVLNETTAALGAILGLFSILMGIFVAGGWLQVFLERTEGHSVRRFFHGGIRHFWRFFRVFLLVVVVGAGIRHTVYRGPWHDVVETRLLELPDVPSQGAAEGPRYSSVRLDELPDELTARRVVWVQDGLHAVLMALLLTWATYTRTRLALHDASSAVWAGLCTFFTMLRHPIRTLRPMLLLLVVEVAVVVVAQSVHAWMENGLAADASRQSVVMIFSVSFAVLAVSEILHAARYHAAILVSRRTISPIMRPDPWKHSVGAPGGPQYPILDSGDEYGVSL